MDYREQARPGGRDAGAGDPAKASLACVQDFDRYRHHVAHLDMSDEAKAELLVVVWRIMESFVDRAFGDDAAQLCRNSVDAAHGTHEGEDLPVIDLQPTSQQVGADDIAPAFNKHGGSDRKERT